MNKAERRMLFSTCVLNEGKMYSITSLGGLPIRFDLQSEKIVIINDIENYQLFNTDDMLSQEDNIFALEINGKRLLRYNIKKNECNYYNIDCDNKDWGNYAALASYKETIYIFPAYSNRIVKVNLTSGKTQTDDINLRINNYEFYEGKRKDFRYFCCGCQVDNVVWLFQEIGDSVVTYDMESDTWQEYRIPVKLNGCIHAVFYSKKLYMLSSDAKIYSWNMMNEIVEEIADFSTIDKNGNTFFRIAVTDQIVFLLPSLGKDIFYINLNTKKINKFKSYPDDFCYLGPEGWSKFYGYCEDEEFYYFAMRSMNYILSLNKKSGEGHWIKPQLPTYQEYIKEYVKYSKLVIEEQKIGINEVVEYLINRNIDDKSIYYNFSGNKIWKSIKCKQNM